MHIYIRLQCSADGEDLACAASSMHISAGLLQSTMYSTHKQHKHATLTAIHFPRWLMDRLWLADLWWRYISVKFTYNTCLRYSSWGQLSQQFPYLAIVADAAGEHSYNADVMLPYHLPEVNDRMCERRLSGYVPQIFTTDIHLSHDTDKTSSSKFCSYWTAIDRFHYSG